MRPRPLSHPSFVSTQLRLHAGHTPRPPCHQLDAVAEGLTIHQTPAALEVLACIAFKQPISQGEIDQIFGEVDKRHLVAVLRQMKMGEEFAGEGGRLFFATTATFLERFGLKSVEEMSSFLDSRKVQRKW